MKQQHLTQVERELVRLYIARDVGNHGEAEWSVRCQACDQPRRAWIATAKCAAWAGMTAVFWGEQAQNSLLSPNTQMTTKGVVDSNQMESLTKAETHLHE